MAITVPNEYSYVLVAVTSTFFVNTFHGLLTSRHRKASGVAYPAPYATAEEAAKNPKAYKFNCAQRAHANFTENLVPAVGAMLIAGLRHPVAAAGMGITWSIARVIYALGYTSNAGPKGREVGAILGSLTDLALKLTAAYTAVTLAMEQF
ncbi:microsomal glutathione S-transferase 3 [Diplogelasinospora grovesii]|uniref:Microsomal glutathione S-transferase 3 n=1 Tax=Diplogelasinospora grovesii TaxID=303347 RepID=A0AAN6S5F6_9PEZI|nr:microsomal glutathione S-transferase 3 [Diplogelasinospora grovesii]